MQSQRWWDLPQLGVFSLAYSTQPGFFFAKKKQLSLPGCPWFHLIRNGGVHGQINASCGDLRAGRS
jgi:hypothetical protein